MGNPARIAIGAAFIVLLFLSGCASTRIIADWKDATYKGAPLPSIIVVGISEQELTRKLFEDEFVRQLKERGVNAFQSYYDFPEPQDLKRIEAKQKLKLLSVRGALVIRLVNVKEETAVVSPQSYSYKNFDDYYYYSYTTSYPISGYSSPAYEYEYTVATLDTNLFDVPTGKSIWTVRITTEEPVQLKKSIREITKVIVTKMSKDGMIK